MRNLGNGLSETEVINLNKTELNMEQKLSLLIKMNK